MKNCKSRKYPVKIQKKYEKIRYQRLMASNNKSLIIKDKNKVLNPQKFIYPYKSYMVYIWLFNEKESAIELSPIQTYNEYKKLQQVQTYKKLDILEIVLIDAIHSYVPIEYIIKRMRSFQNQDQKLCADYLEKFNLTMKQLLSQAQLNQDLKQRIKNLGKQTQVGQLLKFKQEKINALKLFKKYPTEPAMMIYYEFNPLENIYRQSSFYINKQLWSLTGYTRDQMIQKIIRANAPYFWELSRPRSTSKRLSQQIPLTKITKDMNPIKFYLPTKDNMVLEIDWFIGESIEIQQDGVLKVQLIYYGSQNFVKKAAEEFDTNEVMFTSDFQTIEQEQKNAQESRRIYNTFNHAVEKWGVNLKVKRKGII